MKFIEKMQQEHPDKIEYLKNGSISYGSYKLNCPENYGYEEPFACEDVTCKECWNREMPETKNENTKGEKEMPITRKTKKELLEKIAELEKEVERVDQRKQFEDAAIGLKTQYDCLVDVGFSPDNALKILNNMIKSAGGIKR